MKRIVSITMLSTALLVLTALSFVPHHHHRAVMGTVLELCQTSHTHKDQHPTQEHADEEGCVAHGSFSPAKVQSGVTTPDAQVLHVVGQFFSTSVPAPAQIGSQTEYGLFIIAYTSASPNPGSGLRAPPSLS